MEEKREKKILSMTEAEFKKVKDHFDLLRFDSQAEFVKFYLDDYFDFREYFGLMELMTEIIVDKKDFLKELLERYDIYRFTIYGQEVYIFSQEENFIENVSKFLMNTRTMITVCSRCGFEVFPSKLKEYRYQCLLHDEDLYEIETKEISQTEYVDYLSTYFECSYEEAERLMYDYRNYYSLNKNNSMMDLTEFWKANKENLVQKI